ncbi:MAG: type I-U CRISPR-associated protein Csx17 [Polyangiaceae bacterium]|nr:type I-U CRISPR-associated protein Csx17 [Polyangiaceae bacterium]
MIHVHALGGCTPTPLAHYLKALGLLRIVAEQRDPAARGFWKDEHFHLVTALDRDGLVGFLANDYAPSPITSPWNKGSGFFSADDKGLAPLERSAAPRFAPLRRGIADARDLLASIGAADAAVRAIKQEAKGLSPAAKKELRDDTVYKRRLAEAQRAFVDRKQRLLPACRRAWSGAQRRWMDAAIVLGGDNPVYPALLGTGGNDGRLDFTNNLYQRLAELFDPTTGGPLPGASERIAAALWGTPERALDWGATGQYMPGTAGGANSGNGPSGGSLVNAVDLVLTLEGALLFTAHVTRRLDAEGRLSAAAPFTVRSGAAGYGSAARSDEGPRGEQWMPLWPQPSRLDEVEQLLSEGRARISARAAREPLEIARAVARLGTARGVSGFQRYGYIERNGQSKLAVPLGIFYVPGRPPRRLGLLDALETWLHRVRRQSRDDHAPARLQMAERRLSDALFSVVQHPDEAARWQAVLLSLADLEGIFASGSGFAAGPAPPLSPGWVDAADDGSPELRLAVSLALAGATGARDRWEGIRPHWLPLDATKRQTSFAVRGEGASKRLARSSDVVLRGRSGLDDAVALVERRMIIGAQRGERHLPLGPTPGASASLADLAALLAGEIDLDRTLALARALMALDRRAWLRQKGALPRASGAPDDGWCAIRLATLPWRVEPNVDPGTDPAIVRRLAAGDAPGAVELALRRLRAAGIRPAFDVCAVSGGRGRLWAAALAFPISLRDARALRRRLDPAMKGTAP